MGTIIARKRQDGSMAYRAGIVLKQNGRVVHKESRSFDRRTTAKAWMERREKELRAPGGLESARSKTGTLGDVIRQYIKEDGAIIGRTKTQCLKSILECDIAAMPVEEVRSHDLVNFARQLSEGRAPSTVANYMSHLSCVIRLAKPSWGYDIDHRVMADARTVTDRRDITGKSNERDRRPTHNELDKLMAHFVDRSARGRASPMVTLLS